MEAQAGPSIVLAPAPGEKETGRRTPACRRRSSPPPAAGVQPRAGGPAPATSAAPRRGDSWGWRRRAHSGGGALGAGSRDAAGGVAGGVMICCSPTARLLAVVFSLPRFSACQRLAAPGGARGLSGPENLGPPGWPPASSSSPFASPAPVSVPGSVPPTRGLASG